MDDFAKFGINTEYAVIHKDCDSPASCVILSQATGSRTIVHANKNLPEVSLQDFVKLDLGQFKWIHFEVSLERHLILSLFCSRSFILSFTVVKTLIFLTERP